MIKLLVNLCVLLALVSSTYTCKCVTYEPDVMNNKKLCEWNPDFVGIIELTDDGQIEGNNKVHQIRLIEAWKGPTTISKVSTASSSATCGLYGRKNQRLLISSKIRDGSLRVISCSSIWLPADSPVIPTLRNILANCQ